MSGSHDETVRTWDAGVVSGEAGEAGPSSTPAAAATLAIEDFAEQLLKKTADVYLEESGDGAASWSPVRLHG